MGSLEIFVGGVIVKALHGWGTVYAEEDYVAFGVEELGGGMLISGWEGEERVRRTDVSWSSSSSSSMLFQSSYGAMIRGCLLSSSVGKRRLRR
jgi:hypothetical protein